MRLSIFIPSKGRPKFFQRLLSTLMRQVTPDVEVVASLNPPCDSYSVPSWVRVHQNRIDIGGRTNILLGHALCTGDYVWTIGDDEQVKSTGVRAVLEATEGDPGMIVMSDGERDLGVELGSRWPTYAAMLQAASNAGRPWLVNMLTLISATAVRRDLFDMQTAILKTDTLYGQYYGALSGALLEPCSVVGRATFVSGHSSNASIHAAPQEEIDQHMRSYPGVLHDITRWVNERAGTTIPVEGSYNPSEAFDV